MARAVAPGGLHVLEDGEPPECPAQPPERDLDRLGGGAERLRGAATSLSVAVRPEASRLARRRITATSSAGAPPARQTWTRAPAWR
ncbi:MAG: hypothetical protein H0W36_04645 [Gemmatimonadetes bacterium]|nr:hypothetical protein [Gemmatimonadota bacterium]